MHVRREVASKENFVKMKLKLNKNKNKHKAVFVAVIELWKALLGTWNIGPRVILTVYYNFNSCVSYKGSDASLSIFYIVTIYLYSLIHG